MNQNATTKSQLVTFFKQPYPFYYQGKSLWIICGILLLMSVFFNYFFEPFVVNPKEHKMDFFLISLIHAFMAAFVFIVLSTIVRKPNIEDDWTIKKESYFIFILLLLIGISQFLIRDIIYYNSNNWSIMYLLEEVRNTFLVGLLFVLILVPANFMRLNAKYIKTADLLNRSHESFKPNANSKIEIQTNLKDDTITIDINNLLFAKAEGNYVEFYLNEDNVNRIVKRITMKELESALSPYSNIIKTHRSFLVNLLHINSVSGNAQGYKLHLNNFDEPVPVSRNMIEGFNTRMKHM